MNANEMFIEGRQADPSPDLSSLITFMIDDVKNFGSRNTSRSLTIVMPGTKRNNAIFGNIFDVKSANRYNPAIENVDYNFNAAVTARVLIFQNRVQVFKGVLRLLEVVIDRGEIEYEVSVIGELGGLVFALGNKKLEDLDFSQYDTTLTIEHIYMSWDTPGGSGICFPLIDYGQASTGVVGVKKHDWQLSTFRPALFVKEYIDKIFAAAGYRYDCALFNTPRFKRLIVPQNKKSLTKAGSNVIVASGGPLSFNSSQFDPLDPAEHSYRLFWISQSLTDFTLYSDGFSNTGFTYTGAADLFTDIKINLSGAYQSAGGVAVRLIVYGAATVYRTGATLPASPSSVPINQVVTWTGIPLKTGDVIHIDLVEINNGYTSFTNINYSLTASGQGVSFVNVNIGDPIPINDTIPSNILQTDFFVSIIKLFNLYVLEDKYAPKKLIITPFPDFYSGEIVDWSGKLNREKPQRIKPMSELNSRYYAFKYKTDSDYYNEEYRKRYNIGYGDYIYDSEFEFSNESSSVDLIFSGTPLVGYPGEDKLYSTIFKNNNNIEESIDSTIRILQSKFISGVSNWKIYNGTDMLNSFNYYLYAGHLDDPDAPSNDLNFGVPKQLFFTLVSGALQNNQFNVYYSPYLAEITNKDSKMFTGNYWLTPQDIQELDFSKFIYVDGSLFRLNKIEDYNASSEEDCRVELLKVINTKY